jgi:hypothetical protein
MMVAKIVLSFILALSLLTACSAKPGATPAPMEKRDGDLWVRLFSPQDQMTVKTGQIEVHGQAPEESTITVNDIITVVGPDRSFQTTVPLVEGPNSIEVVASDMSGNEVSFLLTVTYQP